jgi:hypothetical protein
MKHPISVSIKPAAAHKGSGAYEVRYGIIWVGLQTSTQPLGGFGIGSEVQFGKANITHPSRCTFIARGHAQRFLHMSLGFYGAKRASLGFSSS